MEILLIGRIIDHVLFFSDLKINLERVLRLARSVWPYGNVQQDKQGVRMGAVNYVAKHQVKSCQGSDFQKRNGKIFRLLSLKDGSIGSKIAESEIGYNRYFHTDQNGEFDQRYFENVQGTIVYKVPIPEAYRRKYWNRYCEFYGRDKNLTDSEIDRITERSGKKFFSGFEKFLSCHSDVRNMDFEVQLNLWYLSMSRDDYIQRMDYEDKRVKKKKSDLYKKYSLTLNSIPYEHF